MPVLSSHSCPETQQFLMTSLRVSSVSWKGAISLVKCHFVFSFFLLVPRSANSSHTGFPETPPLIENRNFAPGYVF